MDKCQQVIGSLTDKQYTLAHTQWVNELGDYMQSAEHHWSHYKDGSIEFSLTVGQWLWKRSILKWILWWRDGKVPDVRNLLRAAKQMDIDNPLELSKEGVEARLVSCINAIYDLRQNAPSLCDKHLKWHLTLASKREDKAVVQKINRIRRIEARNRDSKSSTEQSRIQNEEQSCKLTSPPNQEHRHWICNKTQNTTYNRTYNSGSPWGREHP